MALTLSQLLDIMSDSQFQFCGEPNNKIFEVSLLEDSNTPLRSGTLYLSDISANQTFPDTPEINILFLPKDLINRYYQHTQSLLVEDYRRSFELSQLFTESMHDSSANEILSTCRRIMRNPLCLLNNNYQLTASSMDDEITVPGSSLLKAGIPWPSDHPAIMEPNTIYSVRQIIVPIQISRKSRWHLIVFESEEKFYDTLDLEYAGIIGSLLSNYIQHTLISNRASDKERFILNILSKELTNPVSIKQQMKNLHFTEHEKYYLLSVEQSTGNNFIGMRNELWQIFKQEIYEYEHYYIVIIGCDWSLNITGQEYPALLPFLKKHSLFAGLSNAFTDFESLSQAYEQSKISISLRKRFSKGTYFSRYEDVILVHLLDIANKNGISPLSFCQPVVTQIYEYDMVHSTEYLKTLATYICNYNNLQQTADKLYVHKNTAYHRLTNIKDLFKIDFDNPRLAMKLRISVSVYNYLGLLQTENLLGPLV